MKKTGRLKQLMALILAGALTAGSVGTPVFGADFGDTAIEVAAEEEAVAEEAIEEADNAAVEESGVAAATNDVAVPEDNENSNVEAYTVTLDANGGYFENEWDDILNESVERTDVLNKVIPVGGTVNSIVPIMEEGNVVATFLGWSLERDGEIVSQADAEYIPEDNCILFALWQIAESEDLTVVESQSQEFAEESIDQGDEAQDSGDIESAEGSEIESEDTEATENKEGAGNTESAEEFKAPPESEDTDTTEESETEFEDAGTAETLNEPSEEGIVDNDTESDSGNYKDDSPEKIETETVEVVSDDTSEQAGVKTPDLFEEEEDETVITEASNAVISGGRTRFSDSEIEWIWTLDSSGTLRITTDSEKTGENKPFKNGYTNEIKSVIITDGPLYIPYYAFSHLPNLTSVSIPSSVVSIGEAAFYQCTSLKNVEIPSSVTSIGEAAFSECSSLTSITIPSTMGSIGYGAFKDCTKLSNITISYGIREIGNLAFSGCSMTNIAIPSSVTSIGKDAFLRCSNLKRVTLSQNVTALPEGIFSECSSLESIEIPGSVKSIGETAFCNCTGLKSIIIPSSVESIGRAAFCDCTSLSSVSMSSGLQIIGNEAFSCCKALTNITIPSSVTSVGSDAFAWCTGLTKVSLPTGLTVIRERTFEGCHYLKDVTLPTCLTTIGKEAFAECRSLVKIVIPTNVTSIGKLAFDTCTRLTSITILTNVTYIGEKAFYDCHNLTIYGYVGSYAESYAIENGIPFVPLYITLYKTGTSEIIPSLINTCGSFSWDNIDDNYSCIDLELAFPADESILVLSANITLPEGFSFEKDSIVQTKTLILKNKSEGKIFGRTVIYPLYSDADTWEIKYEIDEEEYSEPLLVEKSSSSGKILMRPTSIVNGNDVDALEYNIFTKYSDYNSEQAFVLNKSDIYHDELSAVGCMISQAAYNKNRDEATDSSYILSSMHNLGFSQVWFDKNSYIDENGVAHIKPDDVGVGFGTKEVISNGEIYTIVMVAVRGTVDLEWIGNFDVVGDDNTVHNNFQNCANSVMTRFNQYYDNIIGSKTNTKVFIFGHSRGGAVADLVAHSLNDRFGTDNVYSYTFAAPNSTKNPVEDPNIFNYVYKYDIVGFVPQGYGKHGITVVVGGKDKDSCPESVSNAFTRFTKDKSYENVGSDLLVKILLFENDKLNKDISYWKELLGYIFTHPAFVQDGFMSRGHGAENYCSWVLFNGLKQATFYDDYVEAEKENTELLVKGLGKSIEDIVEIDEVRRVLFGLQEALSLINKKIQKSESFVICCPIDVEILNEEGDLQGNIINHDGIIISEDLIAFGDGKSTYLVISDDNKYELVLTGNNEGQMSVISVLANEEGYYVKAQSANSIPVTNNEVFTIGTSTSIYSTPCILSNLGYEYSFVGGLVLSDDTATVEIEPQVYTGNPLTPNPIVTFNNETLVEGTDYTLTYSDNTNVGIANVIISGIGNYVGEITSTFRINASISEAIVSGVEPKTYNGKALTQNMTLKFGSMNLKLDTDYIVSYKNNTNAGTATITITGKGNYTGEITKTFTINKATQSITASNLSLTYPKTGTVTVSGNKGKLTYKSSNTAIATVDSSGKVTAKGAGKATITITAAATSNYNAATKTITVTVARAAQSITAKAAASSIAVGKTTTVSITGAKGTKSFKSSDTTVAAVNASTGLVTAKKVGTVKITATSAATAQYNAASKTVTIKVVPAATASLTAANQATGIKLTWKKVTGANGYKVYRGSTLIKTITSVNTVTFADTKANTNGTKYTYKVVAKASTGDSTLSKSVAVYRVARPAVSSVTNSAASKMTVKWGKNAKANGYQIQYSTDKTFKSGNKAVTVTGASTVSKVIGSLTKGKTYYVRIRTYKTVGSAKYWSVWSSARSVKISK